MPNNTPATTDLVEAVEQAWWDNVRDKMGQPRQAFPKSRTDITSLIAFTIAEINRDSEPTDDAQITAVRAGKA